MDPDRRRIPGFYISERYSQKLKDIRQDKKEIELKIRKAVSEEEKQMLKAKRLRIVVGEEEEEKKHPQRNYTGTWACPDGYAEKY